MRLFILMVICTALATSFAEPDPKKYKAQKKNTSSNTTLTDNEKKFLREVEAKFGIKPDVKEEAKKDDKKDKSETNQGDLKLPFPAVIAIEIVNDTDTKTKGKRTIDANLGYGYKTNDGYSYSYFGKPVQDKGKFMIYPYSQRDLSSGGHADSGHKSFTQVEIQPSKAFELVSVKDENEGYNYPKPPNELLTNYDNVEGLVSPPPSYTHTQQSHGHSKSFLPSTLYTTYNGHEFSGLSGQFPTVMPNYLVDPSQLIKTPEYQNVGLTNDHLQLPGSHTADQRVIPVLVLRVPSSSLRNPTAELFANLPSNYPLSRYLNNVNIQELVNQYFKKMGYSFAPPVMHYQNTIGPTMVDEDSEQKLLDYGRHYAAPYVQPSYTQSDHSGVQYSAVQPVMAKYPSTYPQRYILPHGHSLYQQPMHQQKYEYRYNYVPQTPVRQTAASPQSYYVESQYQQQSFHDANAPETNQHITSAEVEYESSPQISSHDTSAYRYKTSQGRDNDDEAAKAAAYRYIQQGNIGAISATYGKSGGAEGDARGYTQHVQEEQAHRETVASFPSQASQYDHSRVQTDQIQSHANVGNTQNYQYEEQSSEESDSNGLVLAENYPSKDHTIATVYPVSYKSNNIQSQNTGTVQTVSYVTPTPYSSKYRSPYNIMVPQTFLMNPSTEKVAYVNSQSVSAFTHPNQREYNSEEEYTAGPQYVPPISKQKPPSYPKNYHAHPKRMVKPHSASESTSPSRKHHNKNNHKASP